MNKRHSTALNFQELQGTFFGRVVEDYCAIDQFKKGRKVVEAASIPSANIFDRNIVTAQRDALLHTFNRLLLAAQTYVHQPDFPAALLCTPDEAKESSTGQRGFDRKTLAGFQQLLPSLNRSSTSSTQVFLWIFRR